MNKQQIFDFLLKEFKSKGFILSAAYRYATKLSNIICEETDNEKILIDINDIINILQELKVEIVKSQGRSVECST